VTETAPIDITEEFPYLPKAPVTEAVLELRTAGGDEWDQSQATGVLKSLYPGFPLIQQRKHLKAHLKLSEGGIDGPMPSNIWKGLQMQTDDKSEIISAQSDLFSYSRLAPYPGWDRFASQAIEAWSSFVSAFGPKTVKRLGMRFINTIIIPAETIQIEDYLTAPPKEPVGLDFPYIDFLHRDTYGVPGYDYILQVTRTLANPSQVPTGCLGLLLDIDVATSEEFDCSPEAVSSKLAEMRWLKNKAFFGSLQPEAIALLQ